MPSGFVPPFGSLLQSRSLLDDGVLSYHASYEVCDTSRTYICGVHDVVNPPGDLSDSHLFGLSLDASGIILATSFNSFPLASYCLVLVAPRQWGTSSELQHELASTTESAERFLGSHPSTCMHLLVASSYLASQGSCSEELFVSGGVPSLQQCLYSSLQLQSELCLRPGCFFALLECCQGPTDSPIPCLFSDCEIEKYYLSDSRYAPKSNSSLTSCVQWLRYPLLMCNSPEKAILISAFISSAPLP